MLNRLRSFANAQDDNAEEWPLIAASTYQSSLNFGTHLPLPFIEKVRETSPLPCHEAQQLEQSVHCRKGCNVTTVVGW